jgi:hypothetical protein
MSGTVEDCLKQLKALPALEPPAALEARALAAMGRATRRPVRGWLPLAAAWLAVAGATSWLGFHLLRVDLPGLDRDVVSTAPRTSQGEGAMAHGERATAHGEGATARGEGAMAHGEGAMAHGERAPAQGERADADARDDDERVAAWLTVESMRLEQILQTLPPPRRVMRVGTAGTIVGLEDRLAVIDAALVDAGAGTPPPQYRNALLLDRVEVMNALVNVRYAQSQAFTF